jgi:hypothetical protein
MVSTSSPLSLSSLYSGSLENGGADMLLMTSNTRSGGGSQGHAVPRQRSKRSAEP